MKTFINEIPSVDNLSIPVVSELSKIDKNISMRNMGHLKVKLIPRAKPFVPKKPCKSKFVSLNPEAVSFSPIPLECFHGKNVDDNPSGNLVLNTTSKADNISTSTLSETNLGENDTSNLTKLQRQLGSFIKHRGRPLWGIPL